MTDNELLLAISNIVQSQVDPLKHDIRDVQLMLENEVMPRLNTMESCYTSTYRSKVSCQEKTLVNSVKV